MNQCDCERERSGDIHRNEVVFGRFGKLGKDVNGLHSKSNSLRNSSINFFPPAFFSFFFLLSFHLVIFILCGQMKNGAVGM